MDHLNLIETDPGDWSLTMYTGELPADAVVQELGHEPNGVFWDGVAEWLIETELGDLEGRFEFDSEGGMFCAYGQDREALDRLRVVMLPIVTDGERVRRLVTDAESAGFTFDD